MKVIYNVMSKKIIEKKMKRIKGEVKKINKLNNSSDHLRKFTFVIL